MIGTEKATIFMEGNKIIKSDISKTDIFANMENNSSIHEIYYNKKFNVFL